MTFVTFGVVEVFEGVVLDGLRSASIADVCMMGR